MYIYLASLVAQMIKNLTAMQETWVRFLGWKDLKTMTRGLVLEAQVFPLWS